MADRISLHNKLVEILGSKNVYYQPPPKLSYPCIKYEIANKRPRYANNKKYINKTGYTITLIDSNPDSEFQEKIEELAFCQFDRHFTTSGLNHFVYTIFI